MVKVCWGAGQAGEILPVLGSSSECLTFRFCREDAETEAHRNDGPTKVLRRGLG